MYETNQQFAEAVHLFEEGALEEALEHTRQLLAEDDNNPSYWCLEGQIRMALEEIKAAERAFDRACQVAPGLAEPMLHKARFLSLLERYEEAQRLSKQALQYTEEEEDRLMAYIIQAEANIHMARNELMEAFEASLEEMEMMMEEEGDLIQGSPVQTEWLLPEQAHLTPEIEEQLEEGLSLTQRALDIEEEIGHVWYLRAGALLYLDRPQEALESFQRAADLDPDQPEYWHELGLCHEHLEDDESAKEAYRRLYDLETGPDVEGMEFSREEFQDIATQVYHHLEEDLIDMFEPALPQMSIQTKDFPEAELMAQADDNNHPPFNPWLCFFRLEHIEREENEEFHLIFYQRNIEREAHTDDPDELADFLRDMLTDLLEEVLFHDEGDDVIDA